MKHQIFKTDSYRALLSPWFVVALTVLLLNDFVLKSACPSALTGKLSDFAGLFCLPIFICCFVPRIRGLVYLITAIAFCAWKSPLSQIAIDFANSFLMIPIGRTVDYTDLLALLILPLSYHCCRSEQPGFVPPSIRTTATASLVIASAFAFTATQFENERGLQIDRTYSFNISLREFERRLRYIDGVSKVVIERELDKYPDLTTEANAYYIRFELVEKHCDSKELEIFTGAKDEGSRFVIDYVSIRYWCANAPGQTDREQLTSAFERRIVSPLGGSFDK